MAGKGNGSPPAKKRRASMYIPARDKPAVPKQKQPNVPATIEEAKPAVTYNLALVTEAKPAVSQAKHKPKVPSPLAKGLKALRIP